MTIVTQVILFLMMILIMVLQNREKNRNTKNLWLSLLMMLTIAGTSIVYYIYIIKDNIYELIWRNMPLLDNVFYSKIAFTPIDKMALIRLLNYFVCLFVVSNLLMVLNLSDRNVIKKVARVFIAIICVEFIFYEPLLHKYFYMLLSPSLISIEQYYNGFQKAVHYFFLIVNISSVVMNTIILFVSMYNVRKFPFIRERRLVLSVNILMLQSMYFLVYSNYPIQLLRYSKLVNMYFFESIALLLRHNLYKSLPFIITVVVVVNVTLLSVLTIRNKRIHRQDSITTRKIDDSYLGTKVFVHYVKNEILGIKTQLEFVNEFNAVDKATQEELNEVIERCSHVFEHLDKSHNLSKIRSLTMELGDVVVPIDCVVAKIRRKYNATIKVHVDHESQTLNALFDRIYLEKVFENILLNAVEAYKHEKIVLEIKVFERGLYVVIEMKDFAAGISEEHLDRIFEPFYSTKKTSTNWGMGLSYCYKIMKLHGGKIEVESKELQGSTFTLMLPRYS